MQTEISDEQASTSTARSTQPERSGLRPGDFQGGHDALRRSQSARTGPPRKHLPEHPQSGLSAGSIDAAQESPHPKVLGHRSKIASIRRSPESKLTRPSPGLPPTAA